MTGTDLAGNTASGTALTWDESFTNGVVYSRVASAPPPLTNKTTLAFTLYTFRGNGPAVAPSLLDATSTLFESQVQLSGLGYGAWSSSLGASISATVGQDGAYIMTARTASVGATTPTDAYATASVSVDTQPPTLVVVSQPAAIQPDPVVTVKFQTTPINDAEEYFCRSVGQSGGLSC